MRSSNKKAFTIVELVIVIAVIAILAGIMIPTFSSLIKNANIRTDESELVAINTQLATNEIKSEADVYYWIGQTYGADKAADFAPRSARYGYHYWYDADNNQVVLKTYEDVIAEADKRGYTELKVNNDVMFLSAYTMEPLSGDPVSFKDAYKDSFRMFRECFYILDKGGSVVGEALKALDVFANEVDVDVDAEGDDIAGKLNELKELPALASNDLKKTADAILEKVKTVAIVTDYDVYVYDKEAEIKTVYFLPGIETIPSNFSEINLAEDKEGNKEITLPSTVKKVEEGALLFKSDDVKLNTSFENMGAVKEAFQANSTNATITTNQEGYTYKIDGGVLEEYVDGVKTENTETLDYANWVTNFKLTPEISGSEFKHIGDTLYITHKAGSFKVNAGDFEGMLDSSKVQTDVEWTLPVGFSKDTDGNITIPTVPAKYDEDNFAYTVEIKATSVTKNDIGEAKTVTLKVCIVTMTSATIKVGDTQLLLNNNSDRLNTLELTYDGTDAIAEYAITDFTPNFNSEYFNCCGDVSPVFTTSGDLFTIADGKLKLNTAKENLNGTQTFTVTVGDHIEKTFTVTVRDNSLTVFGKVFTNNYLYRVGNANSIKLGQLFSIPDEKRPGTGIEVAVYDASYGDDLPIDELDDNHLQATYPKSGLTAATWANGEIKFTGTGVAIIKIKNDSGDQTIVVEVVDGYNITDASQLKSNQNNILLNDIKLVGDDAKFSLTGDANNHKAIYGNGFKFDITEATTKGNGVITLTYADLDNVQIIGKVYETYQGTEGSGKNQWYASAVRVANGSSRITNSYIFGCRANLRVEDNVEIVDSVLECARLANVDVIAGILTIDGLTTINEPTASNKNVVGLGIMINTNAVAGTEIKVKGDLTQYNWIRESDESYLPNMTGMSTLVDKIFQQTKYLHTVGGVQYANMGIACLNGDIPTTAVSGYVAPYEVTVLSLLTYNGFVVSPTDANYEATEADLVYRSNAYNWKATAQGNTTPTITWKPYNPDVTFEKGQSFEFDPNVLTASKHGNSITPTVTFNDVDYTGKKITFTEAGKYTIKYTVTDPYVYGSTGNQLAAKTYEYYLVVNVITTNPAQQEPVFTFVGSATTTTVVVDGKTYVVPAENTSDAAKFHHIGNGIYAPIVEIAIKDNTSDFTGYYPIFGGITITWYDEANEPTTYSKSSNLSAMPEGLTWITEITNLKGSTKWNGYKKYSDFGLCRESEADGSTNENDTYKNVEFSFQVEGVGVYYYYIRFKEPAHECPSSCITEGTLITMADGTQKPVEDLSIGDMVLAFNHETGKFVATPLIFNSHIDELEPRECNVLHLQFSNGEELKIVGSHGLFDMTLMKYVYLDCENYTSFIGHEFFYAGKDGASSERIVLESAYIEKEITRVFCPVTYFNMNSIANGFLNAPNSPYGIVGPVNYFEYDSDLKYNEEKMQEDIEKYGLYTYDDFKDYISEEAYNSSTAVYLKVAEGKGLITFEEILVVINYLLEGSLIN